MSKTSSQSDSPYVGPRTFERDEGHLYFGREREARDLLSLVLSERLVLFYGQSAGGKSSLINTRLIPGLEERGFEVLPKGRIGSADPPETKVDNIFVYNLLLSLNREADAPRPLRDPNMTISEFLWEYGAEVEVAGEENQGAGAASEPSSTASGTSETDAGEGVEEELQDIWPRAVIIDQFEEILITNLQEWEKREDFFRQLADALARDEYLWVILAIREDYVAGLEPYSHLLPGKLKARFYLQRMGFDAALQAVTGPVAERRPFDKGVAEDLVDNLRQIQPHEQEDLLGLALGQYVKPVQLQVVCYQLWEDLRGKPGKRITADDLTQLAGGEDLARFIDQALGKFYEQAIEEVAEDRPGRTEFDLRNWFERKLITKGRTRTPVLREAQTTGGLDNDIVEALEKRFLLRAEKRRGATWYELAHDRLIEPIRGSNAEWYKVKLSKLQRQAALWDRAQRPEGLLLRGVDLVKAKRWAKHHGDELQEFERDFLARSQRRLMLMIALGSLFILVLGTALFAAWEAGEARRQRGVAIAALADAATFASKLTAVPLTVEAADNAAATPQALADSVAADTPANRETAEIQPTIMAAAQATAEQLESTAKAARLAATVQLQTAETGRDNAFQVLPTLVPIHTPTLTPTPPHIATPTSPTPTPSHTPIPTLTPGYESPSVMATIAPTTRAEEKPGKIAFPLYNWNSGTYDVYICNTDGSNRRQIASQASQPELSPDGKMIAWRSLNPSRLGIVVMNLDRNDVFNVTNYQEDERPSFASDQSLVFFSERESDRKRRLYVVGAWRGAPEKKLVHAAGEFFGETPSWLGTTQIVYKQRDPPSGIFLTDRNGRQSRLLIAGDDKMTPEGSPDGRFIAYTALSGSNWDIYVMNADGTNPRRLTSWMATDVLPTWSPDSSYIGFVSDWCGTWAVWAIRPDGTGRQWLFRMRDTTADVGGNIAVWDSAGWKEGQISWSR